MKAALLRLLQRLGLLGVAFRTYERVQSLGHARVDETAPDGLPVPPPALRVRVAGTADLGWFVESGRRAAESLADFVGEHAGPLDEFARLLDFGCGCGRVVRQWRDLAPTTRVAGSDRDRPAIEWCRRNLRFAQFEVNDLAPPLAFEDASFDLVYALSVFTHLPEDLQLAWMAELRRVIAPGGHLVVSTHGRAYADRLTTEERARFDAGEVVVRWEGVAGSNLCSAFHPETYLRTTLADGFAFVALRPKGATGNPEQDLTLLRRP